MILIMNDPNDLYTCQVLDGMEIFRAIELEGSAEGYTSRPVIIEDCGELGGSIVEEV